VTGSNAPLTTLPGLVPATKDGTPTEAAETVLRYGAELRLFTSSQ